MKIHLRVFLAAVIGGFSLSSCVVDPYGMPVAGVGYAAPAPAFYSSPPPLVYDTGFSPFFQPAGGLSFSYISTRGGSRGCDRPVYAAPRCATPPVYRHGCQTPAPRVCAPSPRPFGFGVNTAPVRHGQLLHDAPVSPFPSPGFGRGGDCSMPRLPTPPQEPSPRPGRHEQHDLHSEPGSPAFFSSSPQDGGPGRLSLASGRGGFGRFSGRE